MDWGIYIYFFTTNTHSVQLDANKVFYFESVDSAARLEEREKDQSLDFLPQTNKSLSVTVNKALRRV